MPEKMPTQATRDALRQISALTIGAESGATAFGRLRSIYEVARAALAADAERESELLKHLVHEFSTAKWFGSDAGWNTAIFAVRGELLHRIDAAKHPKAEG